MPFINIKMLEGRSRDQKRQLIERLTEETCKICHCDSKSVTIVIEDIPKANWGSDGIPKR